MTGRSVPHLEDTPDEPRRPTVVSDSVQRFYDELAPYYHLIYADWRRSVRKQGEALDRLIQRVKGPPPFAVLDCSCGIGTQSIGLALRGYDVRGTDLSSRAVERARQEAIGVGVSPTFEVADFRALETLGAGPFDVVLSCDNALPHLLTDDELRQTVRSMWAKLRQGGLLLVSIRDYERLVEERPRATMPDVYGGVDGRRIVFQTWDWSPDLPVYRVDYFILQERQGGWHTFHQTMVYRALLRAELTGVLAEVGFADIEWHVPQETGYFQSIVTAVKKA